MYVFNLESAWEKLATKTLICSWEKLWLTLLQAYKNKRESDFDKQLNKDKQSELNNLREAIAENPVDGLDHLTKANVNSWLVEGKKEQHQMMTEDEIISGVLDHLKEERLVRQK
ncbi:hypothetical protein QE152_g32050 [Popillia japonica]|uniref:Uncharacterized protein n=1 Tax=Popillia japonica TaxID=7064 RepID=A0AAW1J0K8_POPJA